METEDERMETKAERMTEHVETEDEMADKATSAEIRRATSTEITAAMVQGFEVMRGADTDERDIIALRRALKSQDDIAVAVTRPLVGALKLKGA